MKDLNALVKKWRRLYFSTKDDKVWRRWVDFRKRNKDDLIQLLSADVRDSFKRRAIFLLVVPLDEFNPIYWRGNDIGNLYQGYDWLNSLTPELFDYTVELVVEFVKKLQPLHCPYSKHYSQRVGGVTMFRSEPDEHHDALRFYNNCICCFLERATGKQAEEIFSLFSLNDISTFSNVGDSSGYDPFGRLLYSKKIPNKWKERADDKMHEVITNELAGKTEPRAEWEDAFSCYSDIVLHAPNKSGLPYPIELFVQQLQFIANYPRKKKGSWNFCLKDVIDLLSYSKYDELLYKIAHHVVLEEEDVTHRFSVYDEEDKENAKLLLKKFGERDEELASQIQSLLSAYEERLVEEEVVRDKAEKEEEKILAAMR